jgi:hypothetical protein
MRQGLVLLFLAVQALAGPPVVSLGPLRKTNTQLGKPGLTQVGAHRPVGPKVLSKGKWSKNGWSLGIRSPGAQGLRLHLSALNLPGEASLVVRSPTGDSQTFRGKGPNKDGDSWTGLLTGDTAVLELRGVRKGSLPFAVPELSHLWSLP